MSALQSAREKQKCQMPPKADAPALARRFGSHSESGAGVDKGSEVLTSDGVCYQSYLPLHVGGERIVYAGF